ncbi:MAG TPA: hypothetical protein VFE17_13015 [Candidatus Baltobacteraceae bacterium]|jgi:glycosyltransferase involved in cell wall biosynthesis|nr:hypothetical protein [Candidatus Baltobacteraceae bacterium]
MNKRRAVVVGFDYYARFLADLVNQHSKVWRLRAYPNSRNGMLRAILAVRQADALISFGGPSPDTALVEAARSSNVPIFIIWAGSDVLKAQEDPIHLETIKQEGFINLSDGPWLVDELRALGVHADYLPVTAVRSGGPVKPFPAQFRVITYLPEPRREFYGSALVYQAARALPDVPFIVVGAGDADADAPSNVQFCGMVNDMQQRIDACSVLLRVPEHDGKSMIVLEALARARHVVWNYEFPTVNTARTLPDVVAELRRLKSLHNAGRLPLNYEGRAYVLEHFSRSDIAARFTTRLDAGAKQHAARPARPHRRVAISGLELFCAQVAQYAKAFAPEWEPRLLRTNSRMDVLTSIITLASCDVWYTIGSPITDRWLHLASRILRKPHVVHWVGSDIAGLYENPRLLRAVQARNAWHLAEVDWTADQLRVLGFEPHIAPLPPRHANAVEKPLPPVFTIMLYVPRTRAAFYGLRAFERLMAALREEPVRYIVVGGGTIEAPPGVEVQNLGWRDKLDDVYEQATVLIRYTPRDGLALMVLEALSFGRHVLWTQNFPFTRHISSYGDMEREVRDLLERYRRGELQPQHEAAQAVSRQYNPKRCIAAIARAWSESSTPGVNPELAAEPS